MGGEAVVLCEVGPRDGLQNESPGLSVAERAGFIRRLVASGLRCVEAGAFVSPRAVPQMAGTDAVLRELADLVLLGQLRLPVLVPNDVGLQAALAAGAREIALFTGVTDSFVRHNIGCDVVTSLQRFAPLARQATSQGVRVRGYISVAFGCPYEGSVDPARVVPIARALLQMGCNEISLGDTIGRATPAAVSQVLAALLPEIPADRLAGHFHDTRGMAVANILRSLDLGLRRFDSSVGGLGGCPYAPGASGNVATEEVIYLLSGLGFDTGVDLDALMDAGDYIDALLGRASRSRVRAALRRS